MLDPGPLHAKKDLSDKKKYFKLHLIKRNFCLLRSNFDADQQRF
jgi:hypothetical protein